MSFIRAENISCPHGFSTRLGGVSSGFFASLNLGRLERGDAPQKVAENWNIFGRAIGIDTTRFVHGRQVHGGEIHIAAAEDAHGILEQSSLAFDGYVTDIPGLPLAIFTADCTPLLLHEPQAGVIGAVHCGWRGTVADIESAAIDKMEMLGADRRRIRAAIGPCICKKCFQTGPEIPAGLRALLGASAEAYYTPDVAAAGKFRVDLPGAVEERLLQLGLLRENIEQSGECTMCQPEKYWSHRSMGAERGSQANIIML